MWEIDRTSERFINVIIKGILWGEFEGRNDRASEELTHGIYYRIQCGFLCVMHLKGDNMGHIMH